jgi:hypothetical protein
MRKDAPMTDTGQVEPKPPVEEQEPANPDPIDFSDRVIAFLLLVFPFSVFIDRLQALLLDYVSQYVNNIFVLVGLIGFLVLVGWLSKRVHMVRNRWRTPAEKG